MDEKQNSPLLVPGIVMMGMILRIPFTSIPPVISDVAKGLGVSVSSLGIFSIANKLKPNSTLVFSQEHPITTCHKEGERWEKNEKKQQVAYRLNYYRDEGLRERNWFQQPFKTYHRTTATIINDLIAAGFEIEQMAEPMLAEQPQWHDEFKDLLHRPPLLFIKARKVMNLTK